MEKKSESVKKVKKKKAAESIKPPQSDSSSANNQFLELKLQIPEKMQNKIDGPALQSIAESVTEFLNGLLKASDSDPLSLVTYDLESGLYTVGEDVYAEDEAAWFPFDDEPVVGDVSESINCDLLQPSPRAFDIRHVPPHLEKAYLLARLKAFGEDYPGYMIIFHEGACWAPCQAFQNVYTGEMEYLLHIFNAEPCLETNRHYCVTLDAEVGNLNFDTSIRYRKGAEIDWYQRFWDEIETIRRAFPSYDPFISPYNPNNLGEMPPTTNFFDFL